MATLPATRLYGSDVQKPRGDDRRPSDPISPMDFGATGDGARNDRTAVMLAINYAASNGLPLDGGDNLYGLSGSTIFTGLTRLHIRRLRLKQLAAGENSQTLKFLNCESLLIEDLYVHSGDKKNVGTRDNTTLGLCVEGGTGHHIRNVEATGCGMGAHVRYVSCKDSVFEDTYVHDGDFYLIEPDPAGFNVIDDVLEGIRFDDNERCELVRPKVVRLHGNATYLTRSGVVLGRSSINYPASTKKLFPNRCTRGISGGGNNDCIVADPQIHDVEQGIDFSGSGNGWGNKKVIVQGGLCRNMGSVGMKWGGAPIDCKTIGMTTENCGMYGYIVGGSSRGYKSSGCEFIGCTSINPGYNDIHNDWGDVGSPTYIAEGYSGWLVLSPAPLSIDDVRIIDCKAVDKQGFYLFGDDPAEDPARPWPKAGSTTAYMIEPWTGPTGTYSVSFDTSDYTNVVSPTIRSETKTATLTAGSAVVTWTGGLSNAVGSPFVRRPRRMAYGYLAIDQDGVPIPLNGETKLPIVLENCESIGHTVARQFGFYSDTVAGAAPQR